MHKLRIAICLALLQATAAPASADKVVFKPDFDVRALLKINRGIETKFTPAAIVGKGCSYYEQSDGRGAEMRVNVAWLAKDDPNQPIYLQYQAQVGSFWNDRIQSLRCDDSSKVHCYTGVYADVDKGGGDAIFWGMQGLVNLGPSGWSKKISSLQVFCNLMK